MKLSRKPLVKYRFKDSMGYVFYRVFNNDHEARMWFERYKLAYTIKEFGNIGTTYNANRTLVPSYPSSDI